MLASALAFVLTKDKSSRDRTSGNESNSSSDTSESNEDKSGHKGDGGNIHVSCGEHTLTVVPHDFSAGASMEQYYGSKAFTFSDGSLCTVGKDEKNKCKKFLSPFGTDIVRTSEVFATKDKVCHDSCKECIRGVCVNENEADRSLPRPRLALYHGGVVGCPMRDETCYKQYLSQVIRFVDEKKIDIVFIVLSMPIINKWGDVSQTPLLFGSSMDCQTFHRSSLETLSQGRDWLCRVRA